MSDFETVLNISQTLLQSRYPDGNVSRSSIEPVVQKVLAINASWNVIDAGALIRELESRFNVWIGDAKTLAEEDDHVPWLKADRIQNWRYWPRYRRLLEKGNYSPGRY